MKSKSPLTTTELTRQERLELWMKRTGWTYKALGHLLDITGANAGRRLKSDTIPPHHHKIWAQLVPADLLPKAEYQKPGPKPRSEATA